MLTVMACSTGEFRVATREILQLPALDAVTTGTISANLINGRCRANGVRVAVTCEALVKLFPMNLAMTAPASRHQVGIIFLCRVIGMKNGVTLPAIELMPPTLILQSQKMARMALPALLNRQGSRLKRIKFCIPLRKISSRQQRLRRSGKRRSSNQEKNNYAPKSGTAHGYCPVPRLFRSWAVLWQLPH